MCRSVIICSILFTLIATARSKSIGFVNNEDIEGTTDSRVISAIPLIHDEHESDPRLSAKRSLLVLMPASEEKEEIDCKEAEGHSQKTKRCKTPIHPRRVSLPLSRKEGILKAIQDRLKPKDEIVGASQQSPLTKTDVYDDGKYICYCQQKEDSTPEKGTDQTLVSEPQPTPKNIKPEKKIDGRNMLVGRPILPKKSHPSISQNSANFRPKTKHPILQQKGRERVPYVPYVHRMDPQENPTKFNIPLNSAAVKPDSIVGQQAPIGQQSDFNEDQQNVGQSQCPSEMLGQTLSQSTENTPRNDQQEASNIYDNNLQSAHLNPSEYVTESSIDEEKPSIPEDASRPEDPNVQAIDSKSATQENEYETTGSGALDYSEIKEVTNAYFTSKAYTNEAEQGPTGYDDLHATSGGQNYNVNLQSPLNTPDEDQGSEETPKLGNTNFDGGNDENRDVVLGANNPISANDGSDQNVERETEDEAEEASPVEETTAFVLEGLTPPDQADLSRENEKEDLENDKTIESPDQEAHNEEPEEETAVGSSVNEPTYSADSGNEYTTKHNDFVHESFMTEQPMKSSDSLEDSTLKAAPVNKVEDTMDSSHQSLPFCDNSLLQSTIKSVVNDFAKDGASEETVGSARDEEFLPEIVGIPNLKSILTMPPIEQTIMDKVKDRLSKIISLDRETFDNDKTTNLIRNTLRHMLSAAPIPQTELPPMAVEEHQFKDGKWVTNMVTIAPEGDETRAPTNLEKVQASVKNFLRDPAVGMQAAKHPAVQNMIVQSVRNTFGSENEDPVDDSVVRSALNTELSLMQAENEEPVDDTMTESSPASDSLDVSNIDMKKLLDIAKEEAGVDDTKEHESNFEGDTGSVVHEDNINKDTEKQSVNDGVVGMVNSEEGSMTPNTEELPEVPNYKPSCSETQSNTAVAPTNQESPIEQTGNNEDEDRDLVGMENADANEEQPSFEAAPEHDLAYLGKISLKNRKDSEAVQNLQNSELYYVGDGVKLPLEIRRLNDGSYALSISRRVCEHLLNKECPCCVPKEGNVVRTVRRNSATNDADGGIWSSRKNRISDSESTRSILLNERRKRDSADDSLHIFSMPVESFARRYNLSLNLEKAQAPWNLDQTRKINDRTRNLKNKEKNNVNVDLLRDLLTIHAISDNDKTDRVNNNRKGDAMSNNYQMQEEKKINVDRYRHQRNIDENMNKRVEIVKSILNWLKDMILDVSSK